MYEKVLVALDLSESSERVVGAARDLASCRRARYVCSICGSASPIPGSGWRSAVQRAERHLAGQVPGDAEDHRGAGCLRCGPAHVRRAPRAALTAFPGAGRITPSPPAEGAGGTGHRLGARAPAPAARRPPTGSAEANPGRAGQVAGQVSEREAELPGPRKPGLAEARAVPSASAPPGAGAPGRVTMQVVASGSSVQSSGPPCALSHLALIE